MKLDSGQTFKIGIRRSLLLILLSLLCHSYPTQAALNCRHAHKTAPELFTDLYREAYHRPGLYKPAQCGLNVKKLLLHFEQSGVKLKNPQVIFLLHEKRKYAGGPILAGQLQPAQNRSFEKAWLFHVVVKAEDPLTGESMILDVDYKSVPLPMAKYFDTMFPSVDQNDRLSMIGTKVIDAPTYLKAFEDFEALHKGRDQNEVVGRLRNPQDPQFPVQTVRDLFQ